jgi:hypothetical protein
MKKTGRFILVFFRFSMFLQLSFLRLPCRNVARTQLMIVIMTGDRLKSVQGKVRSPWKDPGKTRIEYPLDKDAFRRQPSSPVTRMKTRIVNGVRYPSSF